MNKNNHNQAINRPPRIQPPLPIDEREIPAPPERKQRTQSILHLLLPLTTVIGYIMIATFARGRSLIFIIPMGMMMVFTVILALYNMQRDRRQQKEAEIRYDDRLKTLRKEMNAAHDEQQLYYEHTHPPIKTVTHLHEIDSQSWIGSRLWERRPHDRDFASFRIGKGDIPSHVIYTLGSTSNRDENPQFYEAQQLAADSRILSDAPVIIPMREYPEQIALRRACHSIGIAGGVAAVPDFTCAIVTQMTAFHSPNDMVLYVIGAPHTRTRWDWARWLPHTNSQPKTYLGDRMCFEPPIFDESDARQRQEANRTSPEAFWEGLNKELENRQARLEENDDGGDPTLPFILVVIDNFPAEGEATADWLEDAVSTAAVSTILGAGTALGVGIIFTLPDTDLIPSECRGVIEVRSEGGYSLFRYAEEGLNSPRFVGRADVINPREAEEFARAIRDYTLRLSYGTDLPRSLSILDLDAVRRVDELNITDHWLASIARENADWLRVAIGVQGGGGNRELYFHQDHDGVHGIIAGTTGSGKSELLLTLVAGLAMRYEPSILNFLLVDYKGGTAFEPFSNLPHVVDMLTDTDDYAVERMFTAIRAEIARRNALLAETNTKHIVEYRRKGHHIRQPLPHLFIIVDEFAEMIAANPEYKSHFESITRLGRAPGVSLILAAQRPTGAVTGQMQANMKFRICLRVETVDDSRELLGLSDAKFLPSGTPGRAYLQVGSDSLTLLQVARAGGEYIIREEVNPDEKIIIEDEIDLQANIIVEEEMSEDADENSLTIVDAIVNRVIDMARQMDVPRQYKPWPDQLPDVLSINRGYPATYIEEVTNKREQTEVVFSRAIAAWLDPAAAPETKARWQAGQVVDWGDEPLYPTLGLIDLPDKAKQNLLRLDLTAGSIVLFGAGGWGKTMFLRSFLLALAATHSPRELHMYALDFGRGGLNTMSQLPHLATPIDVSEEARVERLLRILANIISQRESVVRDYGSLIDYNIRHPEATLPALLVIIDNFAEFKEIYDQQIPALISLVRAGRSLGIYFIVTADQTTALPEKLLSLFTQRLTLKMANVEDYQTVVGRGAPVVQDVPGRGLITLDRRPRALQVAVPMREYKEREADTNAEINETFRIVIEAMRAAWGDQPGGPQKVEPLAGRIALDTLTTTGDNTQYALSGVIGMNDLNRQPVRLDLARFGPHCLVIGPPFSGKTTALRTIALSLAGQYSPDEVAIILIDPRQTFANYGGKYRLSNLPHVLETVSNADDLKKVIDYLQLEYNFGGVRSMVREYCESAGIDYKTVFPEGKETERRIIIMIDNHDDFSDFEMPDALDTLSNMARRLRDRGLHIVLCGASELTRNRDSLMRRVESSRYLLVLRSAELVTSFGGRVPYRLTDGEIPPGRGFLVRAGVVDFMQVATTGKDEAMLPTDTDAIIRDLRRKYATAATWRYQGSTDLYERAQKPAEAIRQIDESRVVELDDLTAPAQSYAEELERRLNQQQNMDE